MKTIITFLFVSATVVMFSSAQNPSNKKVDGKALFYSNCAMCHSLNKVLMKGMRPLQHIRELRGKQYVYNFVWNNLKLRYENNKIATKAFNDAGRVSMNIFPNLTKDAIDAICDYIDTQKVIN